jgi:hypothetical protein
MQHRIIEEIMKVKNLISITDAKLNELVKNSIGAEMIDPTLPLRT